MSRVDNHDLNTQENKAKLVAEYEAIRYEVLRKNNRTLCQRHGIGIFIREGMKSWCKMVATFVIVKSSEEKSQRDTHNDTGHNVPVSITDRETVVIVSNMILGALKEVCV